MENLHFLSNPVSREVLMLMPARMNFIMLHLQQTFRKRKQFINNKNLFGLYSEQIHINFFQGN